MTASARTVLLLLGALALAGGAAVLWKQGGSGSGSDGLDLATGRPTASGTEPGEGLGAAGPVLTPSPSGPLAGAGGTAVTPGLRTPSGIDLSDPAQRKARLAELLALQPIPWEEVAALLKVMPEPLDPAARARLVEALRIGDRNGALNALVWAHDPALIPDLFAVVDQVGGSIGARRVALQVLGRMPAGQRDAVVKELEARLRGLGPEDGEVLGAIAERGGAEAMRAVSEYVLRSADASALGQSLVGRFDVTSDPAAAGVLAEALGRVQSPAALETLVRLAGQPGALALSAPLIALDRDDQSTELRERVFESLAQIGSADGLAHLLQVSRQPGEFGERATLALGQVAHAVPEARQALLDEFERASLSPRPELAKASLLETLGTLRVKEALPQVAAALRDGNERVRNSAVRSLGRMGSLAVEHVDSIGGLFASGSEATRIAVAMALGSIGGPAAAKQLEGLLEAPDLGPSLRRTLVYALDNARGGPRAAVPGDDD